MEQPADQYEMMGELSLLDPFQFDPHQFADRQAHVSAQGFYGITHLIRKTAGLSLFAAAVPFADDTGACGETDAPGDLFFTEEEFFGELAFIFHDRSFGDPLDLLLGEFLAGIFFIEDDLDCGQIQGSCIFSSRRSRRSRRRGRTICCRNWDSPCSTPGMCPHPHSLPDSRIRGRMLRSVSLCTWDVPP